jgi:carbohydrate-selective porin OprB
MRGSRRNDVVRCGLWAFAAATILGGDGVAVAAEEMAKRPASIWEQETFSGDWHGLRTALSNHGVDLTIQYINEGFSVLSGGVYSRTSYEDVQHPQ